MHLLVADALSLLICCVVTVQYVAKVNDPIEHFAGSIVNPKRGIVVFFAKMVYSKEIHKAVISHIWNRCFSMGFAIRVCISRNL